MTELDHRILDDLAFDYALIAHQITDWRAKRNKSIVPVESLSNAITDVTLTDTYVGSSTLEINVADPEGRLLHYFDVDGNGRLDAIDLNYPAENDDAWWRMTQMHISQNPGQGMRYTLIFLERAAVYLMGRRGPEKSSRNAGTRAEFIKSVVKKVKGGGGLKFVSKQLERDQVSNVRPAKTPGGGGTKLLWAGDSLAVGTWSFLKKHKGYADTLHEVKTGATSAAVLAALTPRLNNTINQVVFDAGTNDGTTTGFLARLNALYAATGNRDLILMTVQGVSHAAAMNTIISDFVDAHEYVYLGNWAALANDHPELLAKDGIHATHAGYQTRSDLVWSVIQSIPTPALRAPIYDGGLTKDEVDVYVEPPAAKEKNTTKSQNDRRTTKTAGIRENADLEIGGVKATKEQIRLANIILDRAVKQHADTLTTQAIMVAAMGETQIMEVMQGYFDNQHLPPSQRPTNGCGGVFQGSVSRPDMPHYFKIDDTDRQAYYFLMGGKGFAQNGAKSLAKRHPDYTPGNIAGLVEVSGKNYPGTSNRHYDKYLSEAKKWIEAYGIGGDHGTVTTRGQYNFLIPKEKTLWDGIQDLADEVNWRFFVDGRTCFFDSDTTLISQIPAAYVKRTDPGVISWQATWDGRRIATQMTLELVCGPFDFRAGEVLLLQDFGILSAGSTAGLPGRWLITDIDRRSGQVYSSLTLAQPEHAKTEPDAKPVTVNEDDNDDATDVSKGSALDQIKDDWNPRNVIERIVLKLVRDAHVSKGKNPIEPKTNAALLAKNKLHRHLGDGSDHAGWKQDGEQKYAIDIGQGYDEPSADLDALAREILTAFDMPDLGNWKATRGGGGGSDAGNLITETGHKRFRYQLIWRYEDPQADNHYNHIHFGVRRK